MILDKWQQEVLDCTSKRIAVRASRQSGKSTVISLKVAQYAMNNNNKVVVVIAAVERQAQLLFEKIHNTIHDLDKKAFHYKHTPTKSYCKLKNGTQIWCLPTGQSGYGIRGFTVDLLICEEAAYINEAVFTAITPMMAVTNGTMIMLSTPKGATGYFYDAFSDKDFQTWHIKYTECPRISNEFIEQERKRKTKAEFMQEYEAEFLESIQKFFPTALIKQCMNRTRSPIQPRTKLYLGLDFARYGGDDNAFIIARLNPNDTVSVLDCFSTNGVSTAETIQRVLELDRHYHFEKIFLDDGGLGAPILDQFLVTSQVMSKVIGINNAKRAVEMERDEKQQTTTLMKEDLYNNLKALMEQNRIDMINNDELFYSLDCIQFEIKDTSTLNQRVLIYGKFTHLCEALIRAAYCIRYKTHDLWVRYS